MNCIKLIVLCHKRKHKHNGIIQAMDDEENKYQHKRQTENATSIGTNKQKQK